MVSLLYGKHDESQSNRTYQKHAQHDGDTNSNKSPAGYIFHFFYHHIAVAARFSISVRALASTPVILCDVRHKALLQGRQYTLVGYSW